MAPTKFPIYVDQSMIGQRPAQQAPSPPPPPPPKAPVENVRRFKPDDLASNQRLGFNERKIYPVDGGEYSFEELNYYAWLKRQEELAERRRFADIANENEELRQKLNLLIKQHQALQQQAQQLQQQLENCQQNNQQQQNQPQPQVIITKPSSPSHRLSVVPQSLQPAQGGDYGDMSCYGAFNDAPSVVHDFWKNTLASDKFTVPIDQSQYIRDNVPTSTPTDKNKRPMNRRMSRPSVGGSPTLKLSPITETSRDCNSKSSSSSSAMSATPGTAKKPLVYEPAVLDEPDKPVDPNDPTTFCRLLRALAEPLNKRSSYFRTIHSLPQMKNGACFQAGSDNYLVDEQLSAEDRIFTAQFLNDESNDSNSDFPMKTICFRVDQPANEWLYYICDELHRRLVRQKTKPDIELGVMRADPAVFFNDGSVLVDEYYRFLTLDDVLNACRAAQKPFPKSVAAYVALELILLVRGMHSCDVIHTNIIPRNIISTNMPSREDIANVNSRISIIKLLGFDQAIDTRLIPSESYDVDWLSVLRCIHLMFFLEPMDPIKNEEGRWRVERQFKNFPTNVWSTMFDELLNMDGVKQAAGLIDQVIEELTAWIKANINFVLSEATALELTIENYWKSTNKSVRM